MWEIGVDIVDIARFGKIDLLQDKSFYDRVFTARELSYCFSFDDAAPQHLAATFAAKEAIFKAINKHVKISLREIEIDRKDGVPIVNLLLGKSRLPEVQDDKVQVKVTISHSQSYVVAFALAVFKKIT